MLLICLHHALNMRKNLDGPVSECLISIINDFFPNQRAKLIFFLMCCSVLLMKIYIQWLTIVLFRF